MHHKKQIKTLSFKIMNEKANCLHSGDQEGKKINPLQHRLILSRKEWLRTYIYFVLLLPVRFVLQVPLHIIFYMVFGIGLLNLSEEDLVSKPIDSSWRNYSKTILAFLGRNEL